LEPRGLVVSLRQSAFFPSGGDLIATKTYPTLEKLAAVVRSLPNPVQLEGHTDSIPIHNAHFKSNWELSSSRAISILDLFCDHFDLPRNRFAVVGRADTMPVDTNETPEGRARNRRVDLVIVNILGTHAASTEKAAASSKGQPSKAQLSK
jgi:chemotaxis protein MotB